MPAAPVKGSVGLDVIDSLPQKQRRWSVLVQTALGLPNLLGQNQVLASAIATSARVEETTLRIGAGQHCAKNLRQAYPDLTGKDDFADFLDELEAFERLKLPRPNDAAESLRNAAETVLDNTTDTAMRAACEHAIAQLEVYDLREEIAGLGPPPWNSLGAMKGGAAKTKLDLLSIPEDRRQLVSLGGGSANATFWVNRTDGTGKDAKSFLCKPADQGQKVSGVPRGGEVALEQLAARTASMLEGKLGISIGVPETNVIALDKGFFRRYRTPRATRSPAPSKRSGPTRAR